MKKQVVVLLLAIVLILGVVVAKTDKVYQSNGRPFRQIWDYLGDPDIWIESFLDVFVQIEDYDEDMEALNARIDELEAKLDMCQCSYPQQELCNGLDDYGDNLIDEDWPELEEPCGVGDCFGGTFVCSVDGITTVCSTNEQSSEEVCDGQDNDCDGEIDEDDVCGQVCDESNEGETRPCYTGPTGTNNVGLCTDGTQTCTDDIWGACEGEVIPEVEMCDYEDNDCDGVVDEYWPELEEECGVGVCMGGTMICSVDGTTTVCSSDYMSSEEVCGDDQDNDCDGEVDEGC